ncbi:hypothetical protein [Gymnodinialimonas sp. 57CJ19]|uniref:hypothetical protein n=1 Tax=Gymnodinialimonas sp. 57CJ19 TaxID=3138498 RepID=UPI0031342988
MKHLALLPVLFIAACQPTYNPGQTVTLAGGETCTVLGPDPQGTRLDCATRGVIIADIQTPDINAQLNPEIAPGVRLGDIPGVPNIPVIPQTEAEAACRAGQYAQNRVRGEVRGAVEGAVLEAAGLPGNTLGLIRRSQDIARRIEGRPSAPAPVDPCAGL